MKNQISNLKLVRMIPIFAIAASATLALAQAASACWVRKAMGHTITPTEENSCYSFTDCPTGYLCSRGGNGMPDPIVVRKVPCTSYIDGTGTPPNCVPGIQTNGTSMTPSPVPDQTCDDSCLQGIE